MAHFHIFTKTIRLFNVETLYEMLGLYDSNKMVGWFYFYRLNIEDSTIKCAPTVVFRLELCFRLLGNWSLHSMVSTIFFNEIALECFTPELFRYSKQIKTFTLTRMAEIGKMSIFFSIIPKGNVSAWRLYLHTQKLTFGYRIVGYLISFIEYVAFAICFN